METFTSPSFFVHYRNEARRLRLREIAAAMTVARCALPTTRNERDAARLRLKIKGYRVAAVERMRQAE